MIKKFTGKHMLAFMVVGFGIVMAVNFYMASLAVGGFGGVIVKNSYVASQKYNEWLDEAKRQEQLGWEAEVSRDAEGRLAVTTSGTPEYVTLSAVARRPLGERETKDLTFVANGDADYVSSEPIGEGRWIVRLTIDSGSDQRVIQARIE